MSDPKEDQLVAELVAAKDAYRDDPTEANRERKATAVDAVRSHRITVRADRPGHGVGGDAFVAGGEG